MAKHEIQQYLETIGKRLESGISTEHSYRGNVSGHTVLGAVHLAEIMGEKARLLQRAIETALNSDEETKSISTLYEQLLAFRDVLIGDIAAKEFSDIYAQTISYGMFAARFFDKKQAPFSRQEAANLMPKSSPFLRKLFQYIAGYELDKRIVWIVDSLADVFNACDMSVILKDFGTDEFQNDPIVHFYETFLTEYDKNLRVDRGVWYTPQPIVNFMIRAIDDLLISEFDLEKGLADDSDKVQILDPATGTGTFLVETVREIHHKFKDNEGQWNQYVEKHLIPRLFGFEILMAPYTIAHLKLEHFLAETGYQRQSDDRLRIYLTNSLQLHRPDVKMLLSDWLAKEANEANYVKRDAPIMIVMANPPYRGHSMNKGHWVDSLLDDYKKEPEGGKLQERNPKWINDDYVKFLRFAQHFIERNGSGIIAFITNHSFLDNPTFRGMRYNLLQTFDKIYVIDLHGNVKKRETTKDGTKDEGVFDIRMGTSINIFVKTPSQKTSKTKKIGAVFHTELFGSKWDKFKTLRKKNFRSIGFKKLHPTVPLYFFVPKDFSHQDEYDKGFRLQELFNIHGVGVTTSHDNFVIDKNSDVLLRRFRAFKKSPDSITDLHRDFDVRKKQGWSILDGWRNLQTEKDLAPFVKPIHYRPFDVRYIFYEDKLVWRTVRKIMSHLMCGDNIGIVIGRQGQVAGAGTWNLAFLTNCITDINLFYRGGGDIFPLYCVGKENSFTPAARTANFNENLITVFAEKVGLPFSVEKQKATFCAIDVFDYIYAVLHSPKYRERYAEFLKIDFPRIPFPQNAEEFWRYVSFGDRLRKLHLLESPLISKGLAKKRFPFPKAGDNVVESVRYVQNRVFINGNQYFDDVSESVWQFVIGGYKVAEKWLKDRKGQTLSYEETEHYRQILIVLQETLTVMNAISLDGL